MLCVSATFAHTLAPCPSADRSALSEIGNMIKVKIELRNDTPLGVDSGKTNYLAWLVDSDGHPFSGCPLGRSTRGETAAIADLIRPGYAVPHDHRISLSDVEVTERNDSRICRLCDKMRRDCPHT